jgi:hypothetical protein
VQRGDGFTRRLERPEVTGVDDISDCRARAEHWRAEIARRGLMLAPRSQ